MPEVYESYVPVVVVAIIIAGLAAAILVINRILGPRRPNTIKGISYESGCDPIDSARQRFSVKFYMTAILFLVFDLEVVFIYPWAARYSDFLADPSFGLIALLSMLVFITILALGLLYEWKRGAMDWE